MASKDTLKLRNMRGPTSRLVFDSGIRIAGENLSRVRVRSVAPRLYGAAAKQRWVIGEDGSLRRRRHHRIGKAAIKAAKRERRANR